MNIIEVMKKDDYYDLRVTNHDKWMYYDNGYWYVLEHKKGKHHTTMLIETENHDEAVKILLKEDD